MIREACRSCSRGGNEPMLVEVAAKRTAFGVGVRAASEAKLSKEDVSPLDNALAESKTFRFPNMEVRATDGTLFCTLSNNVSVLYRARHSDGGYDAYVTLSTTVTSGHGWYTNSKFVNPPGGLVLSITLQTADRGPLAEFIFPPQDVWCRDQAKLVFMQTVIDPDLFPLTEHAYYQIKGGYTWHGCR